jgi:hypothetical protein
MVSRQRPDGPIATVPNITLGRRVADVLALTNSLPKVTLGTGSKSVRSFPPNNTQPKKEDDSGSPKALEKLYVR